MSPAAERVGVMVVRIWIEESGTSVCARITRTLDVMAREDQPQLVVCADQVVAAVEEWIDAFVSGGP